MELEGTRQPNCDIEYASRCWRAAVIGEIASSTTRPPWLTDKLAADLQQVAPKPGTCGNGCWRLTGSDMQNLTQPIYI